MKDARNIIRSVQLSEKGTMLMEKENKYFFKVDRSANKVEVARAVEELFKVSVTKVNIMNYAGKKKRERGVRYGRTASWKRAVVTVKTGEKIEFV
ncbi:MAG: 50S ribosomal protein L23 [Lentisphaerales bacterium]|jgi:large subunit ribosomal protein L23|nr:MAG: 50S ribosomal protein L23 [Lentisphaerales bacterium]